MSLFVSKRAAENSLSPLPWAQRTGVFGASGRMDTDAALRLSAVWASVRLISNSVAMMPLEAFAMRDGQRIQIKPGRLLTQPSVDASISEWVQMAITSMLLRGNSYNLILDRDASGYPTQMEPLHPDLVGVRIEPETGRLLYSVKSMPVDREDMVHIRGLRLPGVPLGLSPVEYGARTMGSAAAAEAFGGGFFTDGAHPSAVLTTDQQVSQENATSIKDRFKSAITGRDIAVLGAGVKYQAIQVSPEESQFLETQRFGVSQIARLFGVPPEMIGGDSGGSMTYSNVTQRSLDFLTYAVQPWLTRIEDAMFPLVPGAKHVHFNTSALVRMTATDRWNVNKTRLVMGAATVNEVRAEEGQTPLPWGDEPFLEAFNTPAAKTAVQAELLDQPNTKGATP